MLHLLFFIFNWVLVDSEVGFGQRDVPSSLAELGQVLQQVQFLVYVIHDQARVNVPLLLGWLDR